MLSPQRFRVDLRGVVDLLSTAIYSSPQVYLRELIQNAADAITARSRHEPGWRSQGIIITPAGVDGPALSVRDDGVGLSADEITDVLASVGSSLKRDELGMQIPGMLGRFGIGLLSALMISDEIILTTRSLRGGPSLRWRGRSDGTFDLTELDELVPVGTTVELIPRPDDAALAQPVAVQSIASHYAKYLPCQIEIELGTHRRTISEPPPFLLDDLPAIRQYGTELLGATPFAALGFEVPLTSTRGLIFIDSRPVPPNSGGQHSVYVGGMLVSEGCREIAPEWAFFARCVLTSTSLLPTASRESLVHDHQFEATREAIGAALRGWLEQLAATDPDTLAIFVAIHYLGLKALAVHDEQIAPLIVQLLPMETSRGELTIAELVASGEKLYYVPTTDQFRQARALAGPDRLIINATYTWDQAVLARLPELIEGAKATELTVNELLASIDQVPVADRKMASELQRRASAVLATSDAAAVVRQASSADVPSFLITDPAALRRSERQRAREQAPRWSRLMAILDEADDDDAPGSRVLLNWANPLVKSLAGVSDEVSFARSVDLLQLQAVLASGRPLDPAESRRLTATLSDLMLLGFARRADDHDHS